MRKVIDPRTVMLIIPCHDGRVMAETAGGLAGSGGLYAAHSMASECSHVSLVRNLIAGQFLASPFEWLVCIDSDIAFTRRDLELLLEPCDLTAEYWSQDSPIDEGAPSIFTDKARPPRPSRVMTAQPATRSDLDSKTLAAADMLVCAEYTFKNDNLEPIKLGMGFVRIHRSVFERLQELKHDGGPTVEVRRDLVEKLRGICFTDNTTGYPREDVEALLQSVEDKAGQPRLWHIAHKGRMYYDFFPSGPLLSQLIPTGAEWKGEDHGFFTLCMLAGITPRIETRTRLVHIGRKGYPYYGPDVGGGQ